MKTLLTILILLAAGTTEAARPRYYENPGRSYRYEYNYQYGYGNRYPAYPVYPSYQPCPMYQYQSPSIYITPYGVELGPAYAPFAWPW